MGYRTVVVLYNDRASEWAKDPNLGRNIQNVMNRLEGETLDFDYGKVAECVHADTQTLALLDGYDMQPLIHSHWHRNESDEETNLRILKEFADKLGYTVSKKREPRQ